MRWDPLQAMFRVYEGGGDPPPSTSTTTVTQQFSPEEQAARSRVFSEAERIYSGTAPFIGNYQGPRPVDQSQDTQLAQNYLRFNTLNNGIPLAGSAVKATQFGLGPVLYPESNPALSSSISSAQRKLTEAFQAPTGPMAQIRSAAQANNSGGSGSREGIAMGLANRSYTNALGDVSANMTNAAYGQGLDFMKSTMAFSPNMYNLLMQPGLTLGGIGAQNEAFAQEQENYAATERNRGFTSPWSALAPYASVVTGAASPGTSSVGTAPGATANRAAPLGMAMMGAQLGSMIPGLGTGVGALVGGGLGLLGGLL